MSDLKQAGECTAQFLLAMEENNEGFKAENVHAIGFSLGAHVASFASKKSKRDTRTEVTNVSRVCLYSLWYNLRLLSLSGNAIEKASGVKFHRITGEDLLLFSNYRVAVKMTLN